MTPKRVGPALFALAHSETAVLATGCGGSTPASTPTGITISVFQNRLDYGPQILEIEVSNATDAPFSVTHASFVSTRFASAAESIYIAMADNVRRNIYEYYQDYCDFGSDPSKRAGVATLVVASSGRTPLGVTR